MRMLSRANRALLGLLLFGLVSIAAIGAFPPATASAQDAASMEACNALPDHVWRNGECVSSSNGVSIEGIVETFVNFFTAVVAIVAVIMIIWGGFKYITSGGDSGNITTAKNTIIYAIIGLVIVALAQFLVQFVLDTTANSGEADEDEESSLQYNPYV